MVGQIIIRRREAEATCFLDDELPLNQFLEQVSFEVKPFDHLRCERALEHLTVALDSTLIVQGKFALADGLAVDLGDFGGRPVLIVSAAIERDKYDDDDAKKDGDSPISLLFAQKIEHVTENLS